VVKSLEMMGSLVDWHKWVQKVFTWMVQVGKGMATGLNFQVTAEALPRQLVTLQIIPECCQKSMCWWFKSHFQWTKRDMCISVHSFNNRWCNTLPFWTSRD
jgi:hypothetical protein